MTKRSFYWLTTLALVGLLWACSSDNNTGADSEGDSDRCPPGEYWTQNGCKSWTDGDLDENQKEKDPDPELTDGDFEPADGDNDHDPDAEMQPGDKDPDPDLVPDGDTTESDNPITDGDSIPTDGDTDIDWTPVDGDLDQNPTDGDKDEPITTDGDLLDLDPDQNTETEPDPDFDPLEEDGVCQTDDNCPYGKFCDEVEKRCTFNCKYNYDCPNNLCCEKARGRCGQCEAEPEVEEEPSEIPCTSDANCPARWLCNIFNYCEPGVCQNDEQCPEGRYCTEHGRCSPIPENDVATK